MNFKSECLINTPGCSLMLETYTPQFTTQLRWTICGESAGTRGIASVLTEYNQTPESLDMLAEQLELAAVQLRTLISDMNPARAFEREQAAQFAVDRLEDGEVAQ